MSRSLTLAEIRQKLSAKSSVGTPDQYDRYLTQMGLLKGGIIKINGSAGTGKTTLLQNVIPRLLSRQNKVHCGSFTNKAVGVLGSKSVAAKTLHGILYKVLHDGYDIIEEVVEDAKTGKPLLDENGNMVMLTKKVDKWKYQLDPNAIGPDDWFFIDEASMVPPQLWFDIIQLQNQNGFYLVIVGDEKQLGPVIDKTNPLASNLIPYDCFFHNQPSTITLTHNKRSVPSIVQVADQMYKTGFPYKGSNNEVHSFIFGGYQMFGAGITEFNKILCYTNAQRHEWNDEMRQQKFGADFDYKPLVGDIIMCGQKSPQENIDKGMFYEIIDIQWTPKGCCFAKLLREDGKMTKFVEIFIESLTTRGSKGIGAYMKKSGIKFEYGYAITVHKSQGSEWDRVLFDVRKTPFNPNDPTDTIERKRFLYTGATRAAKELDIVY